MHPPTTWRTRKQIKYLSFEIYSVRQKLYVLFINSKNIENILKNEVMYAKVHGRQYFFSSGN